MSHRALLVLILCACGPVPRDEAFDAADTTPIDDGSLEDAFNVFAQASGTVDVFINGTLAGTSSAPGALLSLSVPLSSGENIIVLRAAKGGAARPFVHGQFGGVFGKAGTSRLWKAKVAVGGEATDPTGPWATLGYDDSAWSSATDLELPPAAPFPQDGPARGIWTASASDSTVLARLKLYVPPNWSANAPLGFGRAVTGGAGGAVVTVTTPEQLAAAVSGSTPLIIQVSGVLDFTGSEGPITRVACLQRQCPSPMESQYRVNINEFCAGQPTVNFTYDKAGTTPLLVGSNKTIIGLGPNATLKGKGLRITDGASNVIIRNLTITTINPQIIWGGDAIKIDDADGVWIDHVRFSLINRQMIVTGMGKATNVTISWNEFDGRTPYSSKCNGTHYWVMLIVGATNTITVADNWLHHTSGRSPESGGYGSIASMHFVNDYYDYVPGIGANPYTTNSKYLFEGTYFRNVDHPFVIDTTVAPAPGQAYAPIPSTLASTTSACQAALGRPCVTNIASPQNDTYPLDQSVLNTLTGLGDAIMVPYPTSQVPNAVPHLAGPGHI